MKKVLCIDYHFPPMRGAWVGGFQKLRFVERFGWDPVVVTAAENARYPKDLNLLKHIPKGMKIVRVENRELPGVVRKVLRKLGADFEFPDRHATWIAPAILAGQKIIESEDISLIFSVSPSYSTAFVAEKLAESFQIPWVAEFRDAWSKNDYVRHVHQQALYPSRNKKVMRRIVESERRIITESTGLVTIHPTLKKQFQNDYGVSAEKIEIIQDGFCEEDFLNLDPITLYGDGPTFLFLGSAYSGFQKDFCRFAKCLDSVSSSARIIVVGSASRLIARKNLSNVLSYPLQPKKKSLAMTMGADFTLLFTLPGAIWHSPSKLYDYLRTGRPILAMVPPDGDAAATIRKFNAGSILPYSESELKTELARIIGEWQSGDGLDGANKKEIGEFEQVQLASRLASYFDRVAS